MVHPQTLKVWGGNASQNESAQVSNEDYSEVEDFFGTYVNDYWDTAHEVTLSAGVFTVDGTEYTYSLAEAEDNDSDEEQWSRELYTDKDSDGYYYRLLFYRKTEAENVYSHEVFANREKNDEYVDGLDSMKRQEDYTTLEITADNWEQYLTVVQRPDVYMYEEEEEPEDVQFEYAVKLSAPGALIKDGELHVVYSFTEEVDANLTYDIAANTFEVSDQALSKYSSAGETERDIKYWYDFGGTLDYGDVHDYSYADGIVTAEITYPCMVTVTEMSGTLSVLGEATASEGAYAAEHANWEEVYVALTDAQEAAKQEETLAKDAATAKDTDGYHVRVFGKYNYTTGLYAAVHYDPLTDTVVRIDIFDAWNPETNTVDDLKDVDFVEELFGEEAESALAGHISQTCYATDAAILVRISIVDVDDPATAALVAQYIPNVGDTDGTVYPASRLNSRLNTVSDGEYDPYLFYPEEELVAIEK